MHYQKKVVSPEAKVLGEFITLSHAKRFALATFAFCALVFAMSLFSVQTASAAALTFNQVSIDATTSGDVKAIGDINGDGFPDLVMGGSEMSWYEYPTWAKHTVATPVQEFTTDMQLADIDGDGDLDIVTADYTLGSNVIWIENPLPTGNPASTTWVKHVVGSHGTWAHDIEVGDLDGDGKIDIVTRKANTYIFFQDTPNSWTRKDITAAVGGDEGIGIGDIDHDGDLDLIANGAWIENPLNARTGTWTTRVISNGWAADTTGVVGDINGDARPDVVFIGQHARGKMAWYEAPINPVSGTWIEHVIDSAMGSHKLNLGDVNRDGRVDIVAGLELQELALYSQESNGTFTKTVLSTSGVHNQRLGDIGNDGDLDIFGANYIDNPPAMLFENTTNWTIPVNQWSYIQVTNNHAQTFGLNFGDINNDGKSDIVSGQFWYKNPGGNLTGTWVQSTALPNSIEAMLVTDIDGDSLADVIGQKTEGSVLGIYWLEASTTTGTNWVSRRIGEVPAASHSLGAQGYRFVDLQKGGKSEIIVSSGNGIWYFTVPLSPETDAWSRVQVNSNPSDEGFGVADIDQDGRLDIAAGTGDSKLVQWYRNPGTGLGNWQAFTIGNMNEVVYPDRFAAADLNGDGRPDIIGTEENAAASGARTFWWEQPLDPTASNWVRHTVAVQGSTNAMDIADVDRDGDIDIILGEHKGTLKTAVWQNNGNGIFTESVVGTGNEAHLGARSVDLDNDGDLDIVNIAYDAPQFIHLYRNDAITNATGTPPDTTAPVISGVAATGVSVNSANIVWTTDELANSQVDYGTTIAYGQTTTLQGSLIINHYVALTGLNPLTLYHYRVRSADASGNTTVSGDYTFTTTNQPALPEVVAAYNFNEGAGTTVADSSGNNLTGILTNGPTWTTGKNGGALNFDGVNDFVELGNPTALGLSGSFTLSAWVYPTNLSGDRDIITKVSNSNSEYHLQTTQNQVQVGFSNGSNNWYYKNVPATGMPLNTWSHVTGVFDDANNLMTVYINGVSGGSQTVTASPAPGSNPVHIGMGWSGQSWSGKIDDVRIYSRALTGDEVTTDMNTPVGGAVVDTTPPVRSGGAPTGVLPETTTTTTLSLTTNENSVCKYSTVANTSYGAMTGTMSTTGSLNHSTTISVTAGNSYTYYVRCADTAGNQNTNDYNITFSVTAPDTTAPTVNLTAPQNGAVVAGTVTVTANASDNRGVVSVEFKVDGSTHSIDTTSPYTASVNTLTLSEGAHTLSARAVDLAGNSSTATITVTVQNADVTPPTVPTNLIATAVSTTQINLSWNASSDNLAVVGYRVYRGGIEIANVTNTSYQNTGLVASTTYSYTVAAYDAAANQSEQSVAAVASTLAADTTPPVRSGGAPTGVLPETTTTTTLSLTTNENSVCKYSTVANTSYGAMTGTMSTTGSLNHSTTISVTAGNSYTYYVRCADTAGNQNTNDYNITFSVTAPDTTAPIITGVSASAITASGAAIAWTTNEASDSQVEYGLTIAYGQSTTVNTTKVTTHSQVLTNLAPSTTYHYRVKSRDAAGNLGTSGDFTFTTTANTGLVAHWKFDEGTGIAANDSSASGYNGVLTNGVTWTTGRLGGAVSFDGVNDYVGLPVIDIVGSAITMATWVNFSSFPTDVDQRFISKANSSSESGHYWMLGHTKQGSQQRLRVRLKTGGTTKTLIANSGNLAANTWYHAVATYDGATIKLYLNGTLVGSTSKTGTLDTNSSVNSNIGRNPDSYGFMNGKLDDMRLYNRALSASEITALAAGN